MTSTKQEHLDTQTRLLDSAMSIFAEKGFRDATIAEICDRASANVAAVNYYFRSKENLYTEAWRRAFRRSFESYPLDGGVPSDASAQERLRGIITSTIMRFADPKCYEFDIIRKERANPTGLLQEIMHQSISPLQRHMAGIVSELLGPKVTDMQVTLCGRSIMSQCVHMMLRERFGQKTIGPPAIGVDTDTLTDHIFRFCLAGILDLRRRLDTGDMNEETDA